MGGTFLAYPRDYQYQFIKDCYDALSGEESATLEEARGLMKPLTTAAPDYA